ncbi:hypothetical protein HGP14_23760 [Rhizobium sp. P32RR-XVIII]|uniref:hypothetical protein n=1 Tax=Rhizobium sp. P32RR-XVIII TaxID=2726738 RepID=UPI0014570652|nr:hypothetical protein [Rhizobium sp. P32RR-XVIII]NLS06333.1 hypothetical protein [Rhizobium sp. P32RR-XVIII]
MSSAIPTKDLTSQNFSLLQRVLSDAGYTEDIFFDQPRPFNVAAKLLIRLFQEGITDPADLAVQLERHFGKPPGKKRATFLALRLDRYAIQGLPQTLPVTFH